MRSSRHLVSSWFSKGILLVVEGTDNIGIAGQLVHTCKGSGPNSAQRRIEFASSSVTRTRRVSSGTPIDVSVVHSRQGARSAGFVDPAAALINAAINVDNKL